MFGVATPSTMKLAGATGPVNVPGLKTTWTVPLVYEPVVQKR